MDQVSITSGEPRRGASDEPSQLFGRYRILRTLAFGGMAQILLAVEQRTRKLVVIKRILPHYAQNHEFVQFFIHEGRLGQRLVHPNVVRTLEAGQVGEVPYIALEYLRGQPAIELLRAAAKAKVDVPLGVAVRIVADAARGLHHAHAALDMEGHPLNVVHRDVTPHNLFVCANGSTKVLDFGIAKAESQLHHTRTGTIKGKFAYLAPEQIKGERIDHRVDVFALGIVLHELITLRPLFRGSNDGETLQKVLTLEVPPPERIRPGVPVGIGAVALRALQRDRDRRLPTAEALADSIEAVAEAEGIDTSHEAVKRLLDQLFPNVEDLGETSPDDVPGEALEPAATETPPKGVGAVDEIPIDVHELVTGPVAAPDVASTNTNAQARRRTGRVALIVVVAAALLGVALFSSFLRTAQPKAKSGAATVPPAAITAPPIDPPADPPADPGRAPPPAVVVRPEAATPRPPVAPTPAPAEATLRLQTDGASSFVVDGKPRKPEADGAFHLAPGRHTVVVSGGALTFPRTLQLDLKPNESALRAVHGGRGQLRLAVTPWAEVSIDGRTLGVTPLAPAELSEGPHQVTLKNSELGVNVKRRVVVTPGKEAILKVDLFGETK